VVVDEVAAIAALVLVVVGLSDGLVGEELVLGKLEDKAEPGLVEVLHPNVDQRLEGLLIPVGDHLSERDLVLHGREPELGDTGHLLGALGGLVLLDGSALILLLVLLTGLNLLVGGLGLAIYDGGALLVQRGELGKVLLLELQDLLLELGLELGVVLLNALQAGDAALDFSGKRLDVAG
jgi:hypothetical protein